jgi:hypothetical protein
MLRPPWRSLQRAFQATRRATAGLSTSGAVAAVCTNTQGAQYRTPPDPADPCARDSLHWKNGRARAGMNIEPAPVADAEAMRITKALVDPWAPRDTLYAPHEDCRHRRPREQHARWPPYADGGRCGCLPPQLLARQPRHARGRLSADTRRRARPGPSRRGP